MKKKIVLSYLKKYLNLFIIIGHTLKIKIIKNNFRYFII